MVTQGISSRGALTLILAVSVVLRIAVALYLGDQVKVLPGIYDQVSYNHLALSLLGGQGYRFETDWYPFTPANTPTAHWSFVYPVYLSAVYAIFGYHPLIARLVQAVLAGILLPWTAYRLGSRLFTQPVGLAAAGLMAFYAYFLYHNAALMTETFFITGVLWSFEVAYAMVDSADGGRWPLLGLVMGSTVLLRQTYLLFVPLLLIWMASSVRARFWIRQIILVGAVVALCVLPWTIRNVCLYDRFLLLNSNAGYAFYTANHPAHGNDWNPDFIASVPPDLNGGDEAELDRALMSRGVAFILNDPARYARLTLSRIPYHFRFWPTRNSRCISVVVRMTSFGVYLPLMVYGVVLSCHKWRRLIPLYLFAVILLSIHILSWPGPRYRFPVDAVLMILAGIPVSKLAARVLSPTSEPRSTPTSDKEKEASGE